MCLFLIKNIYLSIIYIPQYKLVLIFILIKYTVFYLKKIFFCDLDFTIVLRLILSRLVA